MILTKNVNNFFYINMAYGGGESWLTWAISWLFDADDKIIFNKSYQLEKNHITSARRLRILMVVFYVFLQIIFLFQLEHEYRLFDYGININDVIQLMVTNPDNSTASSAPLKSTSSEIVPSAASSSNVNILLIKKTRNYNNIFFFRTTIVKR